MPRADTIVITGSGLVGGAAYTVELYKISPKSGSRAEYRMEAVFGKVTFAERRASGGSGGSGGTSSGIKFSNLFMSQKLSPANIRKARRIDGNATVDLSGVNPKISGEKLAKALEALKPGEKLAMRRLDKKQLSYQLIIDPLTLTTLPETVNFGVSADHKWTRDLFERYLKNKVAATSSNQIGAFGFDAELIVKADVSGLNPKTLVAYTYDRKENTYEPLETATPYIDKDGYLHLRLQSGGTIVLTDAPLMVKGG